MTLPEPFAYATAKHERKHHPSGYASHAGFKPWLRDEFSFRCVYCLEREMWYPNRADSFDVEHVLPKSDKLPHVHLTLDYMNLVYACSRCNGAKGTQLFIDPTATAFGDHIALGNEGQLVAKTKDGERLIEKLHLNESPAIVNRRLILNIIQAMVEHPTNQPIREIFLSKFAFPEILPDLKGCRVPNSKSPSEDSCYHELRQRHDLPDFY